MTDEERVRLLSRADSRSYDRDEIILAEGQYNEAIYILVGGSARVELEAGDQPKAVGRIAPGEAFGEMSLLDGSPTFLSVIADEPSEVYVLSLVHVADLLEEDPRLASHLYHSLAVMVARRLRERTNEIHAS